MQESPSAQAAILVSHQKVTMIDYVQVVNLGGISEHTLEYCRKLNEIMNAPRAEVVARIKALWPDSPCSLEPLPNCPLCFGKGMVKVNPESRTRILKSLSDETVVGTYWDFNPCGCLLYGEGAVVMKARLSVAAEIIADEDERFRLIQPQISEMVN